MFAGGCTIFFATVIGVSSNSSKDPEVLLNFLGLAAFWGGVPFLIGLGIFKLGQWMITDADHSKENPYDNSFMQDEELAAREKEIEKAIKERLQNDEGADEP